MVAKSRQTLDRLFAFDAVASAVVGGLALLAPHRVLAALSGGAYNHSVHEVLRLYGCLRLAGGWVLWHVRAVDDGAFRRRLCEALLVVYALQALTVARALLTGSDDRRTGGGGGAPVTALLNGVALLLLLSMAAAYGTFRCGRGGHLIRVYQLPTSSGSLD